ncbi:hypothetical protein ABF162_24990 (plasmid) [Vibrio coralliilyticus]|uniref:hypothetical protein n=1 Tax=Vibrio coralliilyticus TaxID=190893 RepID=UPI0005128190|nr:hypothetical protein [Vibrio coralliilyticus]AIS58282.1 hypothetical protein JV59_24930 [Vibrio coralliilyticus]
MKRFLLVCLIFPVKCLMATELIVETKYTGEVYRIKNSQTAFEIVIKNTHQPVNFFNGTGFDTFMVKNSDYIVHLEFIEEITSQKKQVSLQPGYASADSYYQIDSSRSLAMYDMTSGAEYASGGGTGFQVTHDTDTVITIPKYLVNDTLPVIRVTLENVGLQHTYGSRDNAASRFRRSLSPNHFPNWSGEAERQNILNRIDASTPVVISGVVSASMDLGAVDADATLFMSADSLKLHGGFSSGFSHSSSNRFAGFTGLAYHSGDVNVFQDLGASVQASFFGLAFTVDKDYNITSDGVILYVSPKSEFSITGAAAQDLSPFIKSTFFLLNDVDMELLQTLYWIHLVSQLNQAFQDLTENIDQVMSELGLPTEGSSGGGSQNGAGGRPGSSSGDDSQGAFHVWGSGSAGGASCLYCHQEDEPKGTVTIDTIISYPAKS